MPKGKQRFSWTEKPATGEVICLDKETNESLTIKYANWGPNVRARLEAKGATVLLQQRTSGDDADDKFAAMLDYSALFEKDDWAKEREGGGLGQVGAHITFIQRKQRCSVTQAQKAWAAKDKTWRAAFLEKWKSEIQAIKDERSDEEEISLDELA